MAGDIALKTEKLCKSFGTTKANIDIDFTVRKGEIRGLIGENGSGKSTLLSQISGMYPFDSGKITLFGEDYAPKTPLEANDRGIGIVVQEFGVIGTLPANINVFLGRTQQYTKAGILDTRAMNNRIKEISKEWGLPAIPFNRLTSTMSVETRKVIELIRALSIDPEILILDEVTQALSLNNRKVLYEIINRYKEMGRTVILISHDLEEAIELSDTLTILRDGVVVDTVESDKVTADEVKRMMVGRNIEGEYYRSDNEPSRMDDVILSVKDLTVKNEISDVSFDVYAGEIVGLCGLSDSGIHTVGKAIYGLTEDRKGKVTLVQKNLDVNNSQVALKNKMAYVPKERDGEGLMLNSRIFDNMALPSMNEIESKVGFLSKKKRAKLADQTRIDYKVRCQGIYQRLSSLSGGNKQKVNLGRWMTKDLDLLILDCPTRGVDVGVKAYIYQLMREAKEKGLAILLISDELTEALGMSDRLLVFNNGKIAKEIARGVDFTEEKVIEVMV